MEMEEDHKNIMLEERHLVLLMHPMNMVEVGLDMVGGLMEQLEVGQLG